MPFLSDHPTLRETRVSPTLGGPSSFRDMVPEKQRGREPFLLSAGEKKFWITAGTALTDAEDFTDNPVTAGVEHKYRVTTLGAGRR